jgi:hypothetical protein
MVVLEAIHHLRVQEDWYEVTPKEVIANLGLTADDYAVVKEQFVVLTALGYLRPSIDGRTWILHDPALVGKLFFERQRLAPLGPRARLSPLAA